MRMDLDRPEANLWDDDSVLVRKLWAYYSQYLYMPRPAEFGVLEAAVSDGAAQMNWEQDTFAFAEAYDEDTERFLGLKAGEHVSVGVSQTALVVEPNRARRQFDEDLGETEEEPGGEGSTDGESVGEVDVSGGLPTRIYARKSLDPVRGIRDFGDLVNEVVSHLGSVEGSEVSITVEIGAQSDGFDDRVRRVVSENATQLGFEAHEFEN